MALRFGFAALIGIVLVSLSGPALSQLAVSEGESARPPLALSEQFSAPRMALIDLEGVLRASNGTLRVRELLDEQRLLFQAEFAEREAGLIRKNTSMCSIRQPTEPLLCFWVLFCPRL